MSYPPPPPPYGYGYGYGYAYEPPLPDPLPPDRGNLALILLLAIGLPLLLLSGAGSVYFVLTAGEASVAARHAAEAGTDDDAPDVLFDQDPSGPPASGSPSPEPVPSTTPGDQQSAAAALGRPLTLTGTDPGVIVAVTVEQLVSPATPADELFKPATGNRYVAVQLALANQGQSAYSDTLGIGALLVDGAGQEYRANPTARVREAQPFDGTGTVTIGAGESRRGALVFEIPETATPATFRFALDGGLATQKGEWRLG
ncbi:DUF4352 domain-containing protein [Nonomuraea wenchangensis]|uniref:DUF4352 domain-containing protein n=1 Tax=Nonomuraea wenchangensis TaxID=568860 RepID=A0A1I0L2H7_9ACTN|nr:DUF4352 domain-containing protein [Nonomuraea wenchangensis]SEU33633.1 protein of unknown function [Nonomuraea wenchangensis]